MLLLAGDAGIGKSTLLQLLADRAAGRLLRTLWGRCSEEPGAPPYWLWIQLLRDWLKGRDPCAFSEVSPGSGATAAELLSPQGSVGKASGGASESADLSRFLFFQEMVQFWRDAAMAEPLVVIIDDLHRDGGASVKLLAAVAEAIPAVPLLLVAAYRQGEVRAEHALRGLLNSLLGRPHVRHVTIDGLSRTDSERLLSTLTGSDPSPAMWRAIAERSEGNPLFLREIAREVARGRLGSPHSEANGARVLTLPDSIRILFEQRMEGLTPTTRQVLEVASVIGRRFDQQTIAAVQADLGAEEVADGLEEACKTRLLTGLPELGRYQFVHELLRETVYEAIRVPRRMTYHRAIGEWIELRHAGDLDLHLPRLAHHFTRAALTGGRDKALEYHTRAARRAERLFSPEEAAGHFREAAALDLARGGKRASELLPALGQMEILAGSAEAAEQTFRDAVEMARASSDPVFLARAVLGLESATWRTGRDERPLVALIEEALASADALEPRLVIDLYSTLCRAMAMLGKSAEALAAFRKSVAAARALGEPASLFQSLRALVALRAWPEFLPSRIEACRECLAIAQATFNLGHGVFQSFDHLPDLSLIPLID